MPSLKSSEEYVIKGIRQIPVGGLLSMNIQKCRLPTYLPSVHIGTPKPLFSEPERLSILKIAELFALTSQSFTCLLNDC
jgi:hypothetical protein